MTYETLLVEQRGAVTLVTLNRPQALNALNSDVLDDLIALRSAELGDHYFVSCSQCLILPIDLIKLFRFDIFPCHRQKILPTERTWQQRLR